MRGFKLGRGIPVAACAVGLLLAGCGGGGGNNDQGIAFRATGMFRGLESIEDNRITCTEPTIQNVIIDQSFTLVLGGIIDFPNRGQAIGNPCGGYIGLENNLLSMGINVREIVIRYEIPGAATSIPDHSIAFSQRILPASSNSTTSSGQSNLIFGELVGQLVPRHMIVFLTQNPNSLPVQPFIMTAFLTAIGQADNGETFITNEVSYQFTIT